MNLKFFTFLLALAMLLVGQLLNAQNDTVYFNGSNIIVGNVKGLNRGVLTIETDYSDSDFKIEWEKVVRFKSSKHYNVALENKTFIQNATITTISDSVFSINSESGGTIVKGIEIVNLRTLKEDFWSRLSASIDLGYSLTKANNLQQFNTRSSLGYKSRNWVLGSNYNQVRSSQNEVEPVERIDASLSANRSFKNSFFAGAQINFLSNTEQLIDLRTTGQLGIGYYLARTNSTYWNVIAGIAFNNETFLESPDPEQVNDDRQSYEGVLSTELNLYDIGDLNILTNTTWYPSLTEAGRNRIDFKFDISYDLPYDFYIKSGITLNYDSKPTSGASRADYVLQTGFGWEL